MKKLRFYKDMGFRLYLYKGGGDVIFSLVESAVKSTFPVFGCEKR